MLYVYLAWIALLHFAERRPVKKNGPALHRDLRKFDVKFSRGLRLHVLSLITSVAGCHLGNK
jgi:hypothetical protein